MVNFRLGRNLVPYAITTEMMHGLLWNLYINTTMSQMVSYSLALLLLPFLIQVIVLLFTFMVIRKSGCSDDIALFIL